MGAATKAELEAMIERHRRSRYTEASVNTGDSVGKEPPPFPAGEASRWMCAYRED